MHEDYRGRENPINRSSLIFYFLAWSDIQERKKKKMLQYEKFKCTDLFFQHFFRVSIKRLKNFHAVLSLVIGSQHAGFGPRFRKPRLT